MTCAFRCYLNILGEHTTTSSATHACWGLTPPILSSNHSNPSLERRNYAGLGHRWESNPERSALVSSSKSHSENGYILYFLLSFSYLPDQTNKQMKSNKQTYIQSNKHGYKILSLWIFMTFDSTHVWLCNLSYFRFNVCHGNRQVTGVNAFIPSMNLTLFAESILLVYILRKIPWHSAIWWM